MAAAKKPSQPDDATPTGATELALSTSRSRKTSSVPKAERTPSAARTAGEPAPTTTSILAGPSGDASIPVGAATGPAATDSDGPAAPPPPPPPAAPRFTQPVPPTEPHLPPERNYLHAWLYSLFLGALGGDRFYLGKTGTALLKLVTLGGFGLWWAIDLVLTILGAQTDHWKRPLAEYERYREASWIISGIAVAVGVAFFAARMLTGWNHGLGAGWLFGWMPGFGWRS